MRVAVAGCFCVLLSIAFPPKVISYYGGYRRVEYDFIFADRPGMQQEIYWPRLIGVWGIILVGCLILMLISAMPGRNKRRELRGVRRIYLDDHPPTRRHESKEAEPPEVAQPSEPVAEAESNETETSQETDTADTASDDSALSSASDEVEVEPVEEESLPSAAVAAPAESVASNAGVNRLDIVYLLVLIGCAGYAMTARYVHPLFEEAVVGWPMPVEAERLVDEPHLFVHGEFWMNIAIAAAVAGASVQFLNARTRMLGKRQRNGVIFMAFMILGLGVGSCLGIEPKHRAPFLLGAVNLALATAVVFAVFGIVEALIHRTRP